MDTQRDPKAAEGAARNDVIRTIAIVLYVTLALLAVAVPNATGNWLRDVSPVLARPVLTAVAHALDDLSDRTGAAWLPIGLRLDRAGLNAFGAGTIPVYAGCPIRQ